MRKNPAQSVNSEIYRRSALQAGVIFKE